MVSCGCVNLALHLVKVVGFGSPHQLHDRQLVGDNDPLQTLGALQELAIQDLGIVRQVLAGNEFVQDLIGLGERGLCSLEHDGGLRGLRGLREIPEGRQMREPEMLQCPEAQHEALFQNICGRCRNSQQPSAKTECQQPKESSNRRLCGFQNQQGHGRSFRTHSLLLRLLARWLLLLVTTADWLLFVVVQLVQVENAQAVQVVDVPIDHVEFHNVIQVQVEAEEQFRDHRIQAMLHCPNPTWTRVSQIATICLAQLLVELPRLMLQGVEVKENVSQSAELPCTSRMRQFEQVCQQRLAVSQKRVDLLSAMLQGIFREEVLIERIQDQLNGVALVRGAYVCNRSAQDVGFALPRKGAI
mmetsp:Transcript_53305/g.173284  ORF Transcript_53305/g.173284 Transcript_53305/m.173284 type:complete len:357 (-) Transcript_53305:1194-2264(-)